MVRELARFREDYAQGRERSASRVYKDDALLELASTRPTNLEELGRSRLLMREGARLRSPKASSRRSRRAWKPSPRISRRPTAREQLQVNPALADLLRVLLKAKSEEAGVASKLIAASVRTRCDGGGRRDLPALRGWRDEVFGNDALAAVPRARLRLSAIGQRSAGGEALKRSQRPLVRTVGFALHDDLGLPPCQLDVRYEDGRASPRAIAGWKPACAPGARQYRKAIGQHAIFVGTTAVVGHQFGLPPTLGRRQAGARHNGAALRLFHFERCHFTSSCRPSDAATGNTAAAEAGPRDLPNQLNGLSRLSESAAIGQRQRSAPARPVRQRGGSWQGSPGPSFLWVADARPFEKAARTGPLVSEALPDKEHARAARWPPPPLKKSPKPLSFLTTGKTAIAM